MAAVEPLAPFAEGIWIATEPVSIVGTQLTATMSVLRLRDGALLVHSPGTLTAERQQAVRALGTVAHLYAPNLFHHSHVSEWAQAFPEARIHAPEALAKKRPDLRIDRTHGAAAEPAFAGLVDELPIAGCRLQETALLYRPAQTLVVADLVHNVGQPSGAWTKTYTRLMGFYDCVALSRALRWTAFSDRAAARRSLDETLGRSFERIVLGHGAPLVAGGKDALARAYAWLAP